LRLALSGRGLNGRRRRTGLRRRPRSPRRCRRGPFPTASAVLMCPSWRPIMTWSCLPTEHTPRCATP
jgi:hypothetical protein